MARVEFTITIIGVGRTVQQAYLEAVKSLAVNPAEADDTDVDTICCEDCDEPTPIDDLVDGQLCKKCHLKEENDEHENGN